MTQEETPSSDIKPLDRLIGTWQLSGGVEGTIRYEWMNGGFFLIQYVDFQHGEHAINGMEIIGHLRPFGEGQSVDIKSRFYSSTGDTFDYVYEMDGDILTIWGGEKGSPAYYQGTFSEDGHTVAGGWVFPGGGGYKSVMTRLKQI